MDGIQSTATKCLQDRADLAWRSLVREACPVDEQLIAGALITPSLEVRDLGVMVDSDLSLKSHVHHVASAGCFHIRQLRLIRRSLTFEAAHSLVCAVVHSRLDYCNGILANAPLGLVNSLQSVLRSAARLILRLPPWASVTQRMLTSSIGCRCSSALLLLLLLYG
jgi:hypothetical protein